MKTELLIIAGSKSDFPLLAGLVQLLNTNKVAYASEAISCHRDLDKLVPYLDEVKKSYVKVIIAVANSVSNMPAIVAGYLADTPITVIGVGLDSRGMGGMDSLLAVNTIPKDVPLLNTGVGEVALYNAGLAAIKILKATNPKS